MIAKFFVAWCSNDTEVTALVGSRVSPGKAPYDTPSPRITYSVIADRSYQTLTGPNGLKHAVLQVDCWSKNSDGYKEVHEVAEAICGDGKLNGYTGSIAGFHIQSCLLIEPGKTDLPWESPIDGTDLGFHRVMMQFSVHYTEE